MAETDWLLHHQRGSQRSSDCDMRRRCNPTNIPECKFTPAAWELPGLILGSNHHFSTETVKTRAENSNTEENSGKTFTPVKTFPSVENVARVTPISGHSFHNGAHGWSRKKRYMSKKNPKPQRNNLQYLYFVQHCSHLITDLRTGAILVFTNVKEDVIGPQGATRETQVGDIQVIRRGERYGNLYYCSGTTAEWLSLLSWFVLSWITCWGSPGTFVRSDQKLNPDSAEQHVWLFLRSNAAQIMACRRPIGRADISHFHFVLTAGGAFLLHNHD